MILEKNTCKPHIQIIKSYYNFVYFWSHRDGKVSEHCYEVIPEGIAVEKHYQLFTISLSHVHTCTGAACHLYFDIEFKREVNPTVDPILVLEIFIQVSLRLNI